MNNMGIKKQKSQRVLSLILCLCLCFSLLPVVPAVAVEGPEFFTGTLDTDVTKVDGFDAGWVLKYNEPVNGVVKIEAGVYNVIGAASYNIRFKYDPEVVSLAKDSVGTATEEWDEIIAILDANTALIPENLYKGGPPRTGSTWVKHSTNTAYLPFEYTLTNEWDKTTGKIKIELQSKDATTMQKMKPYYVDGFIDDTINCTFGQTEFISLYSMYFKVLEGKSISADTLGLYVDPTDNVCPNGVRLSAANDDESSKKALLLGFPQPAVATYDVPFTVIAEAGNTTKFLNMPTVTIAKQGGGATQTFTGGANGILLKDSVAVANSTLSLEAGVYDYTVTPGAADESTHAPFTGTFTVATGTNAMVYLNAQPKSAGTAEAYSFNLFDGESANDDTLLADAEVQVNGIAATTTNGKVEFSVVPNASYTIAISKPGYKSVAGNVSVGAAGKITSMTGITFSAGAVVLDQTRTAVTVEAKDNSTPLADAIVTVSANPAADKKVTPNMAANELPLVGRANASGKATFTLPDGDYIYTIRAAGYQDTSKSLAVTEDKVVVTEADGTGTPLETAKGEATADGNFTVDLAPTTPVAITDPLYYVVGKWDNDASPTKMTVEVYLKNAKAVKGTFGLKFDPAVFSLNTAAGFAPNTNALQAFSSYTVDGKGTVANPISGTGYHAFVWTALGNMLDSSTAQQLIGTYTLDLTAEALNGGYKTMMHSKSLAVAPYTKTDAAIAIQNAYAADDSNPTTDEIRYYNEFIVKYWRDAANIIVDGTTPLPTEFATEGGFQQIYMEVAGAGAMKPSDIRAQFVFENFGRLGATFTVNETLGADVVGKPISGAKVEVKKDGKTQTVLTDAFGTAKVGVSANSNYTYTISKVGYQTKSDVDLAVVGNDVEVSVLMPTDESHKTRIDATNDAQLELLGPDRATNLTDYSFNIKPKAGFSWKDGVLPTVSEITATLYKSDSDKEVISGGGTTTITWSGAANKYILAGAGITRDATYDLVFSVPADLLVPTPTASSPKVYVETTGTNGKFTVTPVVDGNSTFDPAIVAGGMTSIVETLGTAKTTSATYAFAEGGVKSGAITDETYVAYVIDKLLVNGAEVTLTDAQRIHGVSQQLTGIGKDQTITAVYGEAKVKTNGPGPDDDTIHEGPTTPDANANVAFVVGEGGQATVTVDAVAKTPITGPGNASYLVADGKTLTAVFAGGTVKQADGSDLAYELDSVLINGVAAGDKLVGNTLTLSGLSNGSTQTVAVTFKPVGQASNQAVLITQHKEGNGSTTPLGTSIFNIGDSPTVGFVPAQHWKLGKLNLAEPNTAVQDVTANAVKGTTDYSYKVPSLVAGITTLDYYFHEDGFEVQLDIDYGIVTKQGATVTFTRAAAGGVGEKKVTVTSPVPATGTVSNVRIVVPAGTWTATVSKNGFLNYTVSGFTISQTGEVADTYKANDIIYFGKKDEVTASKKLSLILGDATRDSGLIALDDAAQITNSMAPGASADRIERGDLDENGVANLDDIKWVNTNFGKRAISWSYSNFMK